MLLDNSNALDFLLLLDILLTLVCLPLDNCGNDNNPSNNVNFLTVFFTDDVCGYAVLDNGHGRVDDLVFLV
jgi:hypothetical protein